MAKKSGTGVVIGRYQVFDLNPLHLKFFKKILAKHERVIVFLGSNPAPSDVNPIDFEFRWQMFLKKFKEKIEVEDIEDLPDDRIWSQELDRRIMEMKPTGKVVLYGTTENFIARYSGKYETETNDTPEEFIENLIEHDEAEVVSPLDFRAGMMYSTFRRFPTVYPTVDVAVFKNDFKEVLLARKPNETKFRFPGGFADPDDESYEMAALRELFEECGPLEIHDLMYIGSAKIDDWRYRGSSDSVMTHFYVCELIEGEPEPDDDIAELRWFDVENLQPGLFVAEHRVLFDLMKVFLED